METEEISASNSNKKRTLWKHWVYPKCWFFGFPQTILVWDEVIIKLLLLLTHSCHLCKGNFSSQVSLLVVSDVVVALSGVRERKRMAGVCERHCVRKSRFTALRVSVAGTWPLNDWLAFSFSLSWQLIGVGGLRYSKPNNILFWRLIFLVEKR